MTCLRAVLLIQFLSDGLCYAPQASLKCISCTSLVHEITYVYISFLQYTWIVICPSLWRCSVWVRDNSSSPWWASCSSCTGMWSLLFLFLGLGRMEGAGRRVVLEQLGFAPVGGSVVVLSAAITCGAVTVLAFSCTCTTSIKVNVRRLTTRIRHH